MQTLPGALAAYAGAVRSDVLALRTIDKLIGWDGRSPRLRFEHVVAGDSPTGRKAVIAAGDAWVTFADGGPRGTSVLECLEDAGAVRWRRELDVWPIQNGLACHHDRIVLLGSREGGGGRVQAFDLADGEPLHGVDLPLARELVCSGDHVVVAASDGVVVLDEHLVPVRRVSAVNAALLCDAGGLLVSYAEEKQQSGWVRLQLALDPASLAERGRIVLASKQKPSRVFGSPSACVVYVAGREGEGLARLDIVAGLTTWTALAEAKLRIGQSVVATPHEIITIVHRTGDPNRVVALDPESGRAIAGPPVASTLAGSIHAIGDRLVVTGSHGLEAFAPNTPAAPS